MHRGVEVDVCGTCGGVWFHRGELEKVLAQCANPSERLGDGNRASSRPNAATSGVDTLSTADLVGTVLEAVFDFLGGLAS